MVETWEAVCKTPDEMQLVRHWAMARPSVITERLDATHINVYLDDPDLEDEFGEMCDAYGIECRLI